MKIILKLLIFPIKESFLLYLEKVFFVIITILLTGFGRAISEVGAVMVVGGNIEHFTRVMTTAITLQTRMGNLDYAMALGLVLIFLTIVINSFVYIMNINKR